MLIGKHTKKVGRKKTVRNRGFKHKKMFGSLWNLFYTNDVALIKSSINHENVNHSDEEYMRGSVLWHLCYFGPDDPELLRYFVGLGVHIPIDTIHAAAKYDRPKLVRELINLGSDVNALETHSSQTPLEKALVYRASDTPRVLLDAGAQWKEFLARNSDTNWSAWLAAREQFRTCSLAVLGLQRCGSRVIGCRNGVDVLRIVARCIWSLRGIGEKNK